MKMLKPTPKHRLILCLMGLFAVLGGFSPARADSWVSLAATPGTVFQGGSLAYPGTGDFLYAFQGNSMATFWRYSISANMWTSLANAPAAIGNCGGLVSPGSGDFIYALRGGGSPTFWRYSISANTWTALADAPGNVNGSFGNNVLGSTGNDFIYAFQSTGAGSAGTAFWRYSISANTWTVMAAAPSSVNDGGLAYPDSGDYIYGFAGQGQTNFWRYSISGNTWQTKANAPSSMAYGTSIAYPGAGDWIYVLKAFNSATYMRYNIVTDVWENITDTPAPANAGKGAAMTRAGTGNAFYALRGETTTDFWRLGVVNSSDTTAPTGGTLTYGTTSATSAITVGYDAVTDVGTGVASNVMKVAEATLTAGACGAFGAFANTPNQPASTAAGNINFTASFNKCYKFQYLVTDGGGNALTVNPGTELKVQDATLPTGGTLTYAASSAVTAITVGYDAVADTGSGLASNVMKVAEATLTAGACGVFGAVANTPNQPASAAAGNVAFTASYNKCYKFQYVLTDNAGNVTTVDPGTELKVQDTAGPTGGELTYAASSTTTALTVTVAAVTDAGSGLTSNVLKVTETDTAQGGTCGAFGAFANTPNQPTSAAGGGVAFTAQFGKCYKFQYVLTDAQGNVTTVDPGTVLTVLPAGLPAPANLVDGAAAGTDIDATGETTRLSAVWDAVTGAVSYYYAIGATVGGTELVAFTEVNATTFTHNFTGLAMVSGQRYYVSVRAKDAFGVLGTVATTDGFVVDTTPPAACAVTGFTAAAGATCQFASGTTLYYNNNAGCNAGGGQVSVAVTAGADAESGHNRLVFPDTFSTGGTVNNPGNAYTYTWTTTSNFEGAATVSTFNGAGASNTCAFTVARDMTNPTGGSVSVAAYASTTAVSVTLAAAQDVGAGVAGVVLQVAQAAVNEGVCGAFGDYANTPNQPAGALGETVSFSGENGNCYRFRTLVTDKVGNQLVGEASSLVLVDTNAPTTAMTEPAAAFQASTVFTVAWSATETANGSGVESITVQYRDGENGAWLDWLPTTPTGASRQFTGENGHTYFFRVSARDKAGNVSALPANPDYLLKTEVDTNRLGSPALLSDGSGSQDVDFSADAASYSGSWSAVAGAVSYQYALGTTPGGVEVQDWTGTSQTTVSLAGLQLAQGATVYLSVRGVNKAGVLGNVGSTDGLLIDTTPPAAPVVTDEGVSVRGSNRLVFRIIASDAQSGLASVHYALGLTPGGTDVRGWRETPLSDSLELNDLELVPGKTYYLSVRAVNRAGLGSPEGVTDGVLRVLGALVTWTTIPEKLVAQTQELNDVQVPVEFVYLEKGGAQARFDRMNLRWVYPGGLTKELPEQTAELQVPAQSEWRQKTTLVIPWEVASFALSGRGEADLVMERTWRGLDGNGNDTTFVQAIPIRLTKTGVSTPLEVGEIGVDVEGMSDVVVTGAQARAVVNLAGRGTVSGQWLLNGEVVQEISGALSSGDSVELPFVLSDLKDGENTLQLRITQPEYKESPVVRFMGKALAQVGGENLTDFWAGPFNVTGVAAKPAADTGAYKGEGLLMLPMAEEPVAIVFENLRLVRQQEKVSVKKDALVGMTDFSLTKGSARLKLSKVLVGPSGVLADGEVYLKETKDTPGIGPLYFYGLEISPDGFTGEVDLQDPQKGSLGVFELEISKLRFSFKKSKAEVKAEGVLVIKTGERSVDMRLPLVFETQPGGGVRMSGGSTSGE